MKTKRTLLVTVVVSAMMLSATLVRAAGTPLTITDLSGTVRIQQGVPCGQMVDVNASIQEGRVDLAYILQRESALFDLSRLDMFLTPFQVEVNCIVGGVNLGATAVFDEIGIKLVDGVIFEGEAVGGIEDRLFRFTIPKEKFLIFETVHDNNPVPQPETSYRLPSEDVTGLINLSVRHRSVQLHVVLKTQLLFRAGCQGNRCLINEKRDGTAVTDILAAKDPGMTPPIVSCTRNKLPGGSFKVSASDDALTPPVIKLGTFTIGNNEIIQLVPSGQPGVKLVETTRTGGIRLFQVGSGENFVTATDPQGSVGIAFCR